MTSETRESERRALEDLVFAVAELQPAWDEHLADNGELLPHVFMGDVARFARSVADSGDEEVQRRLGEALEQLAASEDDAVVNLIHVSFIELFVWGDPDEQRAFADLKKSFGRAMFQRIQEFEDWADQAADHARKFGFPGRSEVER